MIAAQLRGYTKNHSLEHSKQVNCMVYELYLHKAIFLKTLLYLSKLHTFMNVPSQTGNWHQSLE